MRHSKSLTYFSHIVFVMIYQSCPRVGWTRGSGRVTIWPDFGGSGRVRTSEFLVYLLVINSGFLNPCESSNTAFYSIRIGGFSTIFNLYNT